MRCRPGIVADAELGTIPDQQCSTALCFVLHSIRDTAILDSRKPSLYITALAPAEVTSIRSASAKRAQVAQLVEHCTENAGVGGSIPPLGTTHFSRRLISKCLSM
jgi:hypothetical protein